jgi:hypothetical protein
MGLKFLPYRVAARNVGDDDDDERDALAHPDRLKLRVWSFDPSILRSFYLLP